MKKMGIKAGDKVAFINEDLEGEVLSVSETRIVIIDQDGFQREVSPSEVIKKKDFLSSIRSISPKSVDIPETSSKVKSDSKEPEVVDLHFHEIHPSDKGLSNFEKLNIQLDFASDKINAAKRKGHRSLVFIHGKGAGVLKSELRAMVKNLENCYYEDADWRKYGEGATTVYIGFK